MKIYGNRPYVICHILSAIDGKIDGDFFRMPELLPVREELSKIRREYGCDAVLNGAVTAAEIYAYGYWEAERETGKAYPREDFVGDVGLKNFIVVVDPKGSLRWGRNVIDRKGQPKSHVIEILTEDVCDGYLTHLQEVGISYVFAGKDALDARLALHKLKTIFGIDTLMITGGGIVNWSFLQAGMIDELSMVICPLADGKTDTATVFDHSSFVSENVPVAFSLLDVRKLEGDGIWLRYLPKNAKE